MKHSRPLVLRTRNPYHSCTIRADTARCTYVGSVVTEDASEVQRHGRVLIAFGRPGQPLVPSPQALESLLSAFVDFGPGSMIPSPCSDPVRIGYYLPLPQDGLFDHADALL